MTRPTTTRLTGWCAATAISFACTISACLGTGGDDDDEPAEDCVAVRKHYIEAKALHDRAVSRGIVSQETAAALELYVSEHWDCFR